MSGTRQDIASFSALDPDDLIGKVIADRYQIVRLLGSGINADTFLAFDRLLEGDATLKVIRSWLQEDESIGGADLWRGEARKAMKVRGLPTVASIYDVGSETVEIDGKGQNVNYLVWEYIEGVTLNEFFLHEKSRINVEVLIEFGLQILQALRIFSHHGLVHGDLHGNNILVDIAPDWSTIYFKIIDFGLAEISHQQQRNIKRDIRSIKKHLNHFVGIIEENPLTPEEQNILKYIRDVCLMQESIDDLYPLFRKSRSVKGILEGIEETIQDTGDTRRFTENLTGRRIGKYSVLSRMKTGGTSTIFLAMVEEAFSPLRKGDIVVMKVLDAPLLGDPAVIERFEEEARIGRSLTCPHSVRYYDFGNLDSMNRTFPYIVMEFVQGRSLAEVRDELQFIPEEMLISLAIQICEALDEIHQQGLVHRDLKAQNMILTKDNDVRLLDFGLSGVEGEYATTDSTLGFFLGTLMYAAPEQFGSEEIDRRADLYSLGLTLYELAVGRHPFEGSGIAEIVSCQLTRKPEPPIQKNFDISPFLDALILRLLEKEPDKRFQTAAELKEALTGRYHSEWWLTRQPPSQEGPLFESGTISTLRGMADSLFVGRQTELNRLTALFMPGDRGSPRLIMVSGEPGSGKTRLLHEALQKMKEEFAAKPPIFRCTAFTGGLDSGVRPMRELLLSLIREHPGAEGRHEIRERLLSAIGLSTEDTQVLLEFLFSPVPTEAHAIPGMEGVMRAVRKLLQAASTQADLLFVLDNFQWADRFTQELVLYIARNMTEENFRMVLVGRELEGIKSLLALTDIPEKAVVAMELHGLGISEQMLFFEDNAPSIQPTDAELQFLNEQYQGNPFHLLEAMNFARDIIGALGDEAGSKRWPSRPVLLKRKFRGLNPELKECIDIAAVQGEIFSAEEICSLTGRDRIDVLKFLSQLEEQGRLVSRLKGMDFIFASPLIHQVAYDEIPSQTRMEYHRTLAGVFERRVMVEDSLDDPDFDDGLSGASHFESMVHHLLRGGEIGKLFSHLFRYLNLLTTTFRNEDARKAVELARELLDGQPSGEARWEREYELNLFLIKRGQYLGLSEKTPLFIEQNERLAELLKSPRRICEVLLQCSWLKRRAGDLPGSYDCASRAVAIAEEEGFEEMQPRAHLALGNFFWSNRDIPSALASWTTASTFAQRNNDNEIIAEIQNNLGNARLALGDSAQAREAYEVALADGGTSSRPTRVKVLGNLAHLDGIEGNILRAFNGYRNATREAMQQGDLLTTARLQLNMAGLALRHGMFTIAETLLPEAEETAREFGDRQLLADVLVKRIEFSLEKQDGEAPDPLLDELIELENPEDKRRMVQLLKLSIRITLKRREINGDAISVPQKDLREFNFLGTQLGLNWVPAVSHYFYAHFAVLSEDYAEAARCVEAALQALPHRETLPHPFVPSLFWVGYQAYAAQENDARALELIQGGIDWINRETAGLADEEVRICSKKNVLAHRLILTEADALNP